MGHWTEEPPPAPPGWTMTMEGQSPPWRVPRYVRRDGWKVVVETRSDGQIGPTWWAKAEFAGALFEPPNVGWGLDAVEACLAWVERNFPLGTAPGRQTEDSWRAQVLDLLHRVASGEPVEARDALILFVSCPRRR